MRPPHRNRAPLTPVVATKFILKYYRGQCATIFIEQQVYNVSRLFLVEKKKIKLSSLFVIISVNSSLKKIFPFHVKLNSSREFFNDCLLFEKRRVLHFFSFRYHGSEERSRQSLNSCPKSFIHEI